MSLWPTDSPGVSITVTSITDFVAFMISSTTVLPALSSFCVYAALGVLALYILQVTKLPMLTTQADGWIAGFVSFVVRSERYFRQN